jgi:hypothetical protein
MNATVFKATKAKDILVGDVWMQMDKKDGKLYYYYLRAESVFIGDKVDAIHDPFTDVFIGNRITNCVEVVWQPLNYEGRPFALRYHESVTVDVASGVVDVSRLIQAEDVNDEFD